MLSGASVPPCSLSTAPFAQSFAWGSPTSWGWA